jgi:cyanate permease
MSEATLLSLCTIAAIALAIGGVVRWARHRDRTRGLLMIAAALVLIGNVAIWAWPAGR